MSNIITVQGRSPAVIAAEIRCHAQNFMRDTFEIGRLLIEAKALVPTGEWMDYLQTELGFKQSTANNFMRIYKEYNVEGQLPESQTFGILTPSKALALLSLPADERKEFMESNDVDSMSVRQLNTAIKERDAAKKAEQTAREQAAAAEKERMEARQELYTHRANEAELKKEVEKLTSDLNKASAAKDKADKEIARLKSTPNIPEDVKKQLIEQAEKDAAAAAEKNIRERLSVMEAQLQEAIAAREAAEASAADSQRMNKDAKFADPDAAAVRILFESLQETYNKISGHLLKISGRDPETAKKMKKIITDWAKGVGGKTA